MQVEQIIQRLTSLRDPKAVAGMARFGINPDRTLGVRTPALRQLAKEIGRDHALALKLWSSGIHEARILASMVAGPDLTTGDLMDAWAHDCDSWDLVDQCCMNLFEKTAFAYDKAIEWSSAEPRFVKRAGFALMARLAVSDKTASDERFSALLPIIRRESVDERNYVKKAVSWALRQIGKRNKALNRQATTMAEELRGTDSRSARWIGADALRELTREPVRRRLG